MHGQHLSYPNTPEFGSKRYFVEMFSTEIQELSKILSKNMQKTLLGEGRIQGSIPQLPIFGSKIPGRWILDNVVLKSKISKL
jgi:hypothetical protein